MADSRIIYAGQGGAAGSSGRSQAGGGAYGFTAGGSLGSSGQGGGGHSCGPQCNRHAPVRPRDNPAANFELSAGIDVRCRACGQVAVRALKGDSLDGLAEAAKDHDCPMKLAPGDWLDVMRAGYEAYRGTPSGAALPVFENLGEGGNAWRDVASAVVRAYLERRAG